MFRVLLFLLSVACFGAPPDWFEEVNLRPGPNAVGFRVIEQRDYTRVEGSGPERSMSMPIFIWYPAARSEHPRMTVAAYRRISPATPNPGAATPEERIAMRKPLRDQAKMLAAVDLTDAEAERILQIRTLAVRDAPVAAGKFPVIVGGFGTGSTAAPVAEYLASRGYMVLSTPSSSRTATLQASRPAVALETHTRNLEFVFGFAHSLPEADTSRLGVVGINFDGMAALSFEGRNAVASAVVSLDGWEGKAGSAGTLRNSMYFDPLRFRAPYLTFQQHEAPPPPGLTLDDGVFDSLRYAARQSFVVEGLNHGQYVGTLTAALVAPAAIKSGVAFVYRRVGDWCDAYIRRDAAALGQLSPQPAGVRLVHARNEAALAPIPTDEEVESMVMSGQVARLTEIYRRAVRENPQASFLSPRMMNLFVFRFEQRGDFATAVAVASLATEAFPKTWSTWFRLGGLHEKANNKVAALAAYAKAREVADAASDLDVEAKIEARKQIEARRAALATK